MKTYGCPVQLTLQEFTTAGIFHLCSHLMVCGQHRNGFVSIDDYLSGLNANPPIQGIRYEDFSVENKNDFARLGKLFL